MVGLGTFVFLVNPKKKLNIIFLLYCSVVAVWLLSTFMMYKSKTDLESILWDRMVYAGVIFIPILMYHFGLVFTDTEEKNKRSLYSGYFLAFIFLILSRTSYFVDGLYKYSWGVHTQARFFHHVFLLFFFVYVILFLFEIYKFLKITIGERGKEIIINQVKYLFVSFVVMNIGAYAFLSAYGVSINPLGAYILEIIAVSILAAAITRYHLFEIRVVLTEILVVAISVLLLIQFFASQTTFEYVWKGLLFLLFVFFGTFLIKSVLKEIALRAELQTAYQELQKLDEAKSEFVSIASHQLRTPLTAIKGYISLLLDGSYGELTDKNRPPIENIYKSSERLIKLINELLNISRIEAGKMEMNFEWASLEEIIDSVIEELKLQAKEKGLYLKKEKSKTPLPELLIDKDKTKQVIMNVVDNAIKYTNKGGIVIKTKTKDSKALIEVFDTGEGMNKEEIAKLFKSFSRGSAGNKTSADGAGLGLHIARRFVEIQGGRIWAESPGRGKGSTIFIELPIKTEKE
jgi:signal transduction histidine kinase